MKYFYRKRFPYLLQNDDNFLRNKLRARSDLTSSFERYHVD
jgi:hypothetical protein